MSHGDISEIVRTFQSIANPNPPPLHYLLTTESRDYAELYLKMLNPKTKLSRKEHELQIKLRTLERDKLMLVYIHLQNFIEYYEDIQNYSLADFCRNALKNFRKDYLKLYAV